MRTGNTGRVRAWLAAALGAGFLAGCGSAPQRTAEPETAMVPPPAARPAPAARPGAPAPAPKPAGRPGGYYEDDGPDDRPLPEPDSIADAVPRMEPLHRFANNPYTAFGQDYTPMRALAPFRQRGLASWYGRRFHGNNTSSGERYDMHGMTAAHPTLPIPSYVRVTRTDNGRSIVVRINDRGPFRPGRIIDLSYAAAHKLGMIRAGSAPVEVETVIPPRTMTVQRDDNAPAPNAGSADSTVASLPVPAGTQPSVFLQVGAFSARANAEGLRDRIQAALGRLDRAIEILHRDGLFRLHLGPYRDRAEAGSIARRLTELLEVKPTVVVR